MLSPREFEEGLARLEPGTPWTHHFDVNGVETIKANNDDKWYRKSQGAKVIAACALTCYEVFSRGKPLSEARILDVASAEGGNAIPFAQAGAKEIVGIEGRKLYVDRADFIVKAYGLDNVRYVLKDVRKMHAEELGHFDFAIVAGILHHLGQDDFLPFLRSLATLARTIFLYTHLSTEDSIKDFALKGPVQAAPDLPGYLLREHKDEATAEEREAQVRASLDNTYSFMATDETLMKALKIAGFSFVTRIYEPHAFGGYKNRTFRVMYVAQKL